MSIAWSRSDGRDEAARRKLLASGAHIAHRAGSIEVGKHADLVVLSRDIMPVPVREILDAKVVMTLVAEQAH